VLAICVSLWSKELYVNRSRVIVFYTMAFYFVSLSFFFADLKNRYKQLESVADAVGVLDFPRKSFV